MPAAELLGGPDVQEPRSCGDELARLRALDLAPAAKDEIAEDREHGQGSEDQSFAHAFTLSPNGTLFLGRLERRLAGLRQIALVLLQALEDSPPTGTDAIAESSDVVPAGLVHPANPRLDVGDVLPAGL